MNDIYFAQIREDSVVERKFAQQTSPRRLVVIGSGGCTALSLLNEQIDAIYCVDFNPAQCALIELKKAAMNQLDRQAYLAFIGERPSLERVQQYVKIANHLPAYAKAYWDERPQAIEIGINQCGATEKFYRYIGSSIRSHVLEDEVWKALLDCQKVEEQREIYKTYMTSESWKTAVNILLSKTTHLLFFPAFMFAAARENDFGQFFLGQFEQEVNSKPLSSNYFLSQLLFSSYLYDRPEGTPYYLSAEGYDKVKRQLHKLHIIHQPLQAFLQEVSEIDAFYLSNVWDWAAEKDRQDICRAILKAKSPVSYLLYRNMLSTPELPSFFMERFSIDEEQSASLKNMERSMMYQRLTVGEIR